MSHNDKYDRQTLINGFRNFCREAEKIVDELLSRQVQPIIEAKYYKDTYCSNNKKSAYTIPTDYLSKNKDSGIRIDYIFCSPNISISNSGIIKTDLSEKALSSLLNSKSVHPLKRLFQLLAYGA